MSHHPTFQQPTPTCPHCAHAMDAEEMTHGEPTCEADLFALARKEGRTDIKCPACDEFYWVLGGFKPHYTSDYEQPTPTCPHCEHAMDAEEMTYGEPTCEADLFALATEEGRTDIKCPACDEFYWVKGGFKPHYTSAYAEEDL